MDTHAHLSSGRPCLSYLAGPFCRGPSLERAPLFVVLGRVELLSSFLQRAVAAVHRPAVERPLLFEALPPRLDVLLAPPARVMIGPLGRGPRMI